MARTNVVSISTNVTPEQKDAVMKYASRLKLTEAQFIRIAVALYIEDMDGYWPDEIIKHGGNRKSKE